MARTHCAPEKKNFGLDAYASANLCPDNIGKGLAASITPKLSKISEDAETAKEHYPDLNYLLFVTSEKVGNTDQQKWTREIRNKSGLELFIIEREEIITQLMMPENASLCSSFLYFNVDFEPTIADLIKKTKRAALSVNQAWARKTEGQPLMDLMAVRFKSNGAKSDEAFELEQINIAIS